MSTLTSPSVTTRSNWAIFGRTLYLLTYFTCLLLALISLPARYANLAAPYAGEQADFLRLTVRYLPLLGISPTTYAAIALASELLWISIAFVIAALIYWQRANEWFPLFSGIMLLTFSLTSIYLLDTLKPIYPLVDLIENLLQAFAVAGIVLFFFLFPNGRFTPRWIWIVALIWVTLNIAWLIFPTLPGSFLNADVTWRYPLLAYTEGVGIFGSGILAQLYRYRHVSTHIERQQTKWIVLGLLIFYLGFVLRSSFFGQDNLSGIWQIGLIWLGSWMMIALSVSFGLALLRYRLWEIDLILSRAFVYGSLVAVLLLIYLGIIFAMQTWLNSPSALANFFATFLVAVLFQPLRTRLQAWANRALFGDRDDPIQVLGQLGQRLEGVVDSAEILPTIIDTLLRSLRIPYAAIALRTAGTYTITNEQGTPTNSPLLILPLNYQGVKIGELRVTPRTTADPFDDRDHKLLDTIAQQAGTVVHAVQLTRDLRHSRQRLVTTREEERRRLRRDLHDGLGPTLAAQIFRVGAARQLLRKNPDKADSLLVDLEQGLEDTLAEIRRVVYALRPPALDQLGLIGATKDFLRQYHSHLDITFDHAIQADPLSAAVEVAAFRIMQTALDNVSKHAQADCCQIALCQGSGALHIQIVDDGIGISADYQAGVGLTSIRERADELDGSFKLTRAHPHGTRLVIALPLTNELESPK